MGPKPWTRYRFGCCPSSFTTSRIDDGLSIQTWQADRRSHRRLLADAAERTTSFGVLRVISTEGLIGFKLQGLVNNPRRTQDLEDIRALLRANRASLKMDEVREYFRLFQREPLLDELLNARD